mgnify:CR=1 FL=1
MISRREFVGTIGGGIAALSCGSLPAMTRPFCNKGVVDTIFKTKYVNISDCTHVWFCGKEYNGDSNGDIAYPITVSDTRRVLVPMSETKEDTVVEDALHVLYASACDRNVCLFTTDNAGLSNRLVYLMKVAMPLGDIIRRNGRNRSKNRTSLTHILVPHTLDWPSEIHGVSIVKCDIDQEYIKNELGARLPKDRRDFVIGLNLRSDSFRIYKSEDLPNHVGITVLDNKNVILGAI